MLFSHAIQVQVTSPKRKTGKKPAARDAQNCREQGAVSGAVLKVPRKLESKTGVPSPSLDWGRPWRDLCSHIYGGRNVVHKGGEA